MIVIDLCLSDIPKDMMIRAKNDKVYCKVVVAERKEPDKFGNDLTVFMSNPKENREKPRVFVGCGKTIKPKSGSPNHTSLEGANINPDVYGDLPF